MKEILLIALYHNKYVVYVLYLYFIKKQCEIFKHVSDITCIYCLKCVVKFCRQTLSINKNTVPLTLMPCFAIFLL